MSDKLKILFPVGALYPNESGGVSLSLYWLLKGLYATKKVTLTTITSTYGIQSGKIKANEWLTTDYGEVIYLHTNRIYLAPEIIKVFLKKVKDTNIVHLSSIFYPPSIICFFIALYYRKTIVWSTRGSVDDVEFQKKGILKIIIVFLLSFFTKKVIFHSTSDSESEFIKKRLGKHSIIKKITNFIVLSPRKNLKKEPFFLYIGRFHSKKGIDNLLIALSKSKLFVKSNFILKIAGEYQNEFGNYILNLYKSLNLGSKVEFLGAVTGDEKQQLLSKSYFSFMPSHSENFGIAAAEALAQGTPVVASVYTPWESLNVYQAGFWVDNTPETLVKIIDKIILMPHELYQLYVKNTNVLVTQELDIFSNTQVWLELYQKSQNV